GRGLKVSLVEGLPPTNQMPNERLISEIKESNEIKIFFRCDKVYDLPDNVRVIHFESSSQSTSGLAN
ncbi:7842_t:CDS:2, partial [Acaulospora morrowiae]